MLFRSPPHSVAQGDLDRLLDQFLSTLVPLDTGWFRGSGCASFVSVMETPNLWNGYYRSEFWRLHGPRFRRVLTERQMCSRFVIVRHERPHMPVQRGFVDDDHVVQTFAPNRSDQAFNVGSLPR